MCENLPNRKCLHQVGKFFLVYLARKTNKTKKPQKTRLTNKFDMSDYSASISTHEILKMLSTI